MAPPLRTIPVQPARLLTEATCLSQSIEFHVNKLVFEVPFQHDQDTKDNARVPCHVAAHQVHGEKLPPPALSSPSKMPNGAGRFAIGERPILLYLCGGPGADNPPCRVPAMNRWLLQKGYSVLYVDYRGCGESSRFSSRAYRKETTELSAHPSQTLENDRKKASIISKFCQDNIVRDLEAIRLCISALAGKPIKWTILGQSYGGYISLSYLSMYPKGLEEVFITGGLPPCGMELEEYFRTEYRDIVAKNRAWYAEYPDGDALVRRILRLITMIGPRNIQMTGRGYMTGQKLLTLGRQLGSKVGFPEIHKLLLRIERDLTNTTRLGPQTIEEFESILHVDERPLYPILLEQTWASGGKTNWAAERVARAIPGFEYLRTDGQGNYPDPSLTPADQPIYFTANTYCRFHFDTNEELIDLKGAAELLHQKDWECPYDYDALAANKVPVYAVVFEEDMHLDAGVAEKTAAKVGGLRVVRDPGWHQDIRYKPAEVLDNLFRIRQQDRRDREQ